MDSMELPVVGESGMQLFVEVSILLLMQQIVRGLGCMGRLPTVYKSRNRMYVLKKNRGSQRYLSTKLEIECMY